MAAGKVLVIDDEKLLVKSTCMILTRHVLDVRLPGKRFSRNLKEGQMWRE